ncbi:hypothetical protein [Deinococcus radiodurans]|jgi:hypothetical protein|uniref:Uncharacterized protein n=2 Tax=Deinococcus radiodurans TaxID=1299 RepID=Q9RTL6_DEIRA|nr:hypothetical protein [Deinococcus radiodurans]AAF11306.1 hypothetical protein DR_1744 [Deinococcus radiodurans R1 = ATCC 13939 = DSM 20539]ANC71158.1 hypothetical protein A2G07_04875 [Deinococcus radiodurans R1 = ATCC 13939 = DSM 20539]QEM71166.1 hypothetical protein DXG80_04895 [Deinococcus radiodurans]QIP29712.1 hypothetical protein HAV23_11600 [Deinococcus radiodurans]UDL00820.1 hypothetical protein E5E91_08980 [Deinococcus radiodurans R1 = ATCC 13939 = DSM 20539]
MMLAFREALTALLPAPEDTLRLHLQQMTAQDWAPLADLFAARLPEFDAVVALPGAETLGEQVAQMRGVPLLHAGTRALSGPQGASAVQGEALLLTPQLGSGDAELAALQQARDQGLNVTVLGTAVERTSLGGRQRLTQLGVTVRAALQLADTPEGLNLERRTPDRWLTSA